MNTLNKISKGVNRVSGWILIACFTLMTITYFGQVVLRYVFQTGAHWTEELTRYTNIAMVMVGTAYLSGQNKNVNVTIINSLVPERFQKITMAIQQLITAVFFAAVIYVSFQMIDIAGTQVSTNLRIPMKFIYAIFPVSFTILIFQVFVYIMNLFRGTSKELG